MLTWQMCDILHTWVYFTAYCVDKKLKEIVQFRSHGDKNNGITFHFDHASTIPFWLHCDFS